MSLAQNLKNPNGFRECMFDFFGFGNLKKIYPVMTVGTPVVQESDFYARYAVVISLDQFKKKEGGRLISPAEKRDYFKGKFVCVLYSNNYARFIESSAVKEVQNLESAIEGLKFKRDRQQGYVEKYINYDIEMLEFHLKKT